MTATRARWLDVSTESDAALDLVHVEKLAGLGTLTAGVAHELGNPLSVISATCASLQHSLDVSDLSLAALADALATIERSADRCTQIVSVLRTYGRHAVDGTGPVDLNAVAAGALTLVTGSAARKDGPRIETALTSGLPSVNGDANQLMQVAINLLTNARDALAPAGGCIWLSSRLEEDGRCLALEVADDGPGIPTRLATRIFEPFFTTKPAGQGTGLGLSIAAEIVARHDGRLLAANRPEGGAIFTVLLPLDGVRG